MTTAELLGLLRKKELMVYGAGYVADLFYLAMKRHGLESRIKAFLVSSVGDKTAFHGIPLMEYDATDTASCLVLAALHQSNLSQIDFKKNDTVINIYPYLWELLFGEIRSHGKIDIKELLQAQEEQDQRVYVRYAALKGIIEEDQENKDLYLRCMSLHCDPETARKRLNQLKGLWGQISEQGFDGRHPICIDETMRIIDGTHRLAVAAYLGVKELACDIYPASPLYHEVFQEKELLPDRFLEQQGLLKEREVLHRYREEILGRDTVSLILPVYNVEAYIDTCMESVCAQTYRDLDILLINDGSTDGSLAKCKEWEAKDRRIRVIDKRNEGVAASRNLGVRLAKGSIIGFVDPDDWLDLDYVRKLVDRMKECDADYVECDLWRYDGRTGKKIYRSCGSCMSVPYSLPEHMKYGPTATYKALSKKALWDRYQLHMPSCSFESPAIYSLILALSNKIANVEEALYYYRRFRPDSLIENGYAKTDGSPDLRLAIDAMEFLISEFKRTGIYNEYADVLEGIVKYRFSDILAMQYHRMTRENYLQLLRNYDEYLQQAFPESDNSVYITWGGYNLNKILEHLDILHDPDHRFNFSSVISLLKQGNRDIAVTHPNRYRKMMIEKEARQAFWQTVEDDSRYLFIDLIEERFDILETESGYLTLSDAYQQLGHQEKGRIIARKSEECFELFTQAFRLIHEHCQDRISLIVIENYLSEMIGNIHEQHPYEDLAWIREMNRIMKRYYDHIRENYPDVLMIETGDLPLYFTDEKYEYGAIPSHLNEIVNKQIAKRIAKKLTGKRHA